MLADSGAMAETRTVEPADLRTVATGLRFPEGPVALADGSVLLVEIARGRSAGSPRTARSRWWPSAAAAPTAPPSGPTAPYVCNNGGCFDWQERLGLLFPGSPPPASWNGGSLQRVDLATGA